VRGPKVADRAVPPIARMGGARRCHSRTSQSQHPLLRDCRPDRVLAPSLLLGFQVGAFGVSAAEVVGGVETRLGVDSIARMGGARRCHSRTSQSQHPLLRDCRPDRPRANLEGRKDGDRRWFRPVCRFEQVWDEISLVSMVEGRHGDLELVRDSHEVRA
jgi:hypothetical protein